MLGRLGNVYTNYLMSTCQITTFSCIYMDPFGALVIERADKPDTCGDSAMQLGQETLNRIASYIIDEINGRAGPVEIVTIEFSAIDSSGRIPLCTFRTRGGTVKDRLKIAQTITESMERHKRKLEA